MPSEDRRIFFDNEEVYKALYALNAQKQTKNLPPGQISKIYYDEADATKILIEIENPQDTSNAKLDYSRDFLAAALLLFCKGSAIPLPKNAQKSVLIKDNQVTMRIQV